MGSISGVTVGAGQGSDPADRVEKLRMASSCRGHQLRDLAWARPTSSPEGKAPNRLVSSGGWFLLVAVGFHLQAVLPEVTFGKTPSALVGVRMAKTLGVHDGGGRILNSEGSINEEGVF